MDKKAEKKGYFLLFVSLIILISLFSCMNKNSSDVDIIKNFDIAEKIFPTRHIDATAPKQNNHFISGWYAPEEKRRWAQTDASTLSFCTTELNDIELEIKCRSIKLESKEKQTIKIFLNSNYLKTIKLEPMFAIYRVGLPHTHLIRGKNIVAFKYKFTKRPKKVSLPSGKRSLSAAFKYFKFIYPAAKKIGPHKALLQKNEEKIFQQPGSLFLYYTKVPASGELKVNISRLSGSIEAHLEISSEESQAKHIVFNKKGKKTISLKDFSEQYVKLSFFSKSRDRQRYSPKDFVVWSGINISRPVRKSKTNQELSAFQKKLRSGRFDIVYIILDAFHAEHASLYGYNRKTTPFLSEIGGRGIVFKNFFANSPYTLASTGTLFTSRFSHEHGLIDNDTKLSSSISTLPEILSEHAISTYLITELSWFSGSWGLTRGFSEIFFNKRRIKYTAALENIYSSEGADKQKFIYIHAFPPHAPYLPPKKFRIFYPSETGLISPTPQNFKKIENGEIKANQDLLDFIEAMYDANILYADSIAREVYDFFKNNNLLEKTIIIITSDHGDACKMQHGKLGHNSTLFAEMTHIPFVMILPGGFDLKHIFIQNPSSVVDVPQTILDILGIDNDYGFKGRSFLPDILSPDEKSSYVFLENFSGRREQKAIRDFQYKYILSLKAEMLFEIGSDPAEKINLQSKRPNISGYFQQLIRHHFRQGISETEKVDLQKVDKEILRKLKTLGYIK